MNIHEYANKLICIFNTKLKDNVYALIWYFVILCWMKTEKKNTKKVEISLET